MSCESLIRASLTRIDAREREVGAWAYVDRDAALARARALDSGDQTGLRSGLLHGLAVGVKDIIDTADMPTEYGSPIYAGNRPRQDAACVQRLRSEELTSELQSLTNLVCRLLLEKKNNE